MIELSFSVAERIVIANSDISPLARNHAVDYTFNHDETDFNPNHCAVDDNSLSTDQSSKPPTEIPFPTMTVGQRISGDLSTPNARSGILPNQAGDANSVLVNRTTPTPDTSRCPFPDDGAELGDFPSSRVNAINTITQFLNDGGTVQRLQQEILTEWDAFGETGYIETIDLTGEGTVEIVLGYIAPGDVGTLLIFGCQAGQYLQLFEMISDGTAPPAIITLGILTITHRTKSSSLVASAQTQKPVIYKLRLLLGNSGLDALLIS